MSESGFAQVARGTKLLNDDLQIYELSMMNINIMHAIICVDVDLDADLQS